MRLQLIYWLLARLGVEVPTQATIDALIAEQSEAWL